MAGALMFTPDALNLWGNALGRMGIFALPALAAGILLHAITLNSFRRLSTAFGPPMGGHGALRDLWGRVPADLVLFCGKVPLAVGAATGLVVSAGFIFNEVFLYWFPNFAFAYLLLGAALLFNLLGNRAVLWGQGIALAAVLGGLLVLSGWALWGVISANTGIAAPSAPDSGNWPLTGIAAAVVVLMGFDLALYGNRRGARDGRFPYRAVFLALGVGGVVLALWGLTGLNTVSRSKLADTTISHIIIARTVGGDTGRYIIGGVVIGGVFAAVNALLFSVGRLLAELISDPHAPSKVVKATSGNNVEDYGPSPKMLRLARSAVALLAALAMAGGWAGEPVLETFIRTGIVFWLFHHLTVNIGAVRLNRRQGPNQIGPKPKSRLFAQIYSVAGICLTIAGMIVWEADRRAMLLLMVAIALTSGLLFYMNNFLSANHNLKRRIGGNNPQPR